MEDLKKLFNTEAGNSGWFLVIGAILFIASCDTPRQPVIPTDEFQLVEGLELSVIAGEPLLDSPVAMSFDLEGNIWVVELPGYMRNIDGTDEKLADGRIVVLSDEDDDGLMDQRRVFIDSLVAPRAIALVYGGLLYTETPALWWVPIEDGLPGHPELVDSLYVVGGNIEHQPNGLLYNLDNWIYSAKCSARYQRKNGRWIKEATTFRGQWGIAHDDHGRLYYNSNSTPIKADYTFPNQMIHNPYHKAREGVNQSLTTDRRLYPIGNTPVNRGYQPGVLDSLGRVKRFTSACGPVVFRGDGLPEEFDGNAFVCGPEANLIKRYVLREETGRIGAKAAYDSSEFLISRDPSFRPVNLSNGPDGALYVLDLRKGVIQHRAYMSSYLRDKTLELGLDSINGMGRIYRISAEGLTVPPLSAFRPRTDDQWLTLLQHPNGQLRSMAQQHLVSSERTDLGEEILEIVLNRDELMARIHGLWTLEGLGLLEEELLLQLGLANPDTLLMPHLLKVSESFTDPSVDLIPLYLAAARLESHRVDLQLCHSIGKRSSSAADAIWLQLAVKYCRDSLFSEALVSGIPGREGELRLSVVQFGAESILLEMMDEAISNRQTQFVQSPRYHTREYDDGRTRGARLYATHCGTCHGMDGKGIDQLAPPLYHSEYVTGPPERLVLIALHGMYGPLEVNGKQYKMDAMMPGVKNNPELSDDDIARILRFVGNGFNPVQAKVNSALVQKIRERTAHRESMFTAPELEEWLLNNLDETGQLKEQEEADR